MESELPTYLADFEGILPDPRYPNWELQLAHHKKINECSKKARGMIWGCEDRSVIEYFLRLSDSIGTHLEHTGRKFWTQSGKYSHSHCEHILQDPWTHNLNVFYAEKKRLTPPSADASDPPEHYHLFDRINMSQHVQDQEDP